MHLPRHAEVWLPGYLASIVKTASRPLPKRLWVTIADHFEPYWHNKDDSKARERVRAWHEAWPRIANAVAQDTGLLPKYSFFYPQEEYRPELLDPIAELVGKNIADVEVHIHHDGEGEQNFVDRMSGFIEALDRRHGLLRRYQDRLVFGFIHGDWCLDNARADGRFCGLNNEITLLARLGCYGDFTLPVTDWAAQTRIINTIYWADDDPLKPRSHDYGYPVETHGIPERDSGLLMVPGPLAVRWTERLFPKMETGELAWYNLPNQSRARIWMKYSPRIREDAFLKLYAHGAGEQNAEALLGGALQQTFIHLLREAKANGVDLRFVSAWEMRQAIATACGQNGWAAATDQVQLSSEAGRCVSRL